MTSLKRSFVLLCAAGAIALTGCAPKMDKETIKNMKPERPAQLAKLDRFAGEWKGSGQCTMAGSEETMQSSGTHTMKWDLDNMILVEDADYSGDMGEMKSKCLWSWDAKHNRFRLTWLDSWGSYGEGWAKPTADGNSWKMRQELLPLGNQHWQRHHDLRG